MLKIKLRSLGNEKPLETVITDGENLLEASKRALEGTPFQEDPKKHFGALVNGMFIEKDKWEITSLKKEDNVLLAPELGGNNTTLRTAAMVAIVIGASALAGPAGFGFTQAWAVSAFTAGASILGSLLINSIFPPPIPGGVGETPPIEDSQMYVITSQSNKSKKLGGVPKSYGTHRTFPTIAANPYTEFEANQEGKLIQYLYAIYDFGLGPVTVDDIRIGDTSISEFSDLDYQLVDFNKPAGAMEPWESVLNTSLKYYRGDVTTTNVGVTFTKNQNDTPTPPEVDFRAVRSGAINPNNLSSELSVLLVAPQGLVAYSANGAESERKVFFDIEFAKEGTEDWKPFNDTNYVYDFRSTGGDLFYTDFEIKFPIYFLTEIRSFLNAVELWYNQHRNTKIIKRTIGLPIGTTSVVINYPNPSVQPGAILRAAGQVIGVVQSLENFSAVDPDTGILTDYIRAHLTKPTERVFEIAKQETQSMTIDGTGISFVNTFVTAKLYRSTVNLTRVVLAGTDTEPIYATYKFWPREPGQYKVRVTRVQSTSQYTSQIIDSVSWSTLTTRLDSTPIITDKRHVFLELRMRATNQLNGTVQNLSAVTTSVLDTWDGTKWVKAPTSNPAWVFVDLLCGEINKRAISKDKLDLPSIYEWAQFCDQIPVSTNPDLTWFNPRFQCNFVFDFASTLQQLVDKVTSAAQASMTVVDGKYGVLIDRKKNVPVQVFTPRNSSNFSSTKSYPRPPHALEVQYIDPTLNWDMGSVRVYADGYNEETATEIEEVTTFAVTNYEQAWRFGRYLMAQSLLRQENITIDVDYEYLVCARGDYVQLVQDAMLAGGKAARVLQVTGNVVRIDDALDNFTTNWGYVIRSKDGVIKSGTATPVDARNFQLDDELPEVGDLIVLGEVGRVVLDCVVKGISPKDDLSATLLLVEKADAIHDTENGQGIPVYDPQLSPVKPSEFIPPGPVEELVVADNAYRCFGGTYQHYITLDWSNPTGYTFEYFEVFVDWGDGYTLATQTRDSIYEYIVDNNNLGKLHKFKVLAVSSSGLKIEIGLAPEVTATPLDKTSPPSDVTTFGCDITGEVLELKWARVEDCDIARYVIRFSALTNGGSWASSIPLTEAAGDQASASVQARTGTYFIKAFDYNGNESVKAARTITTIPNLFNLNIIEEVSDTPAFDGPKDRVVKRGSSIVLDKAVVGDLDTQEYYSEGYYYFRELIDLGEIYTVRIQSRIQASGFTEDDLIINWNPIASADPLSSVTTADWDVEAQYRVTDKRNVMAEWIKLEDINPISEGVDANFSEWRKFTMGDVTGRVIQFRLKLISRKKNVTPRIFDGSIRADMPDRRHTFNNMVAPVTGISLVYDPPFKGPAPRPNIQITIENAQSGDRWEITDSTLEGFTIQFYDAANNPVERTFDVAALGYGYRNPEII